MALVTMPRPPRLEAVVLVLVATGGFAVADEAGAVVAVGLVLVATGLAAAAELDAAGLAMVEALLDETAVDVAYLLWLKVLVVVDAEDPVSVHPEAAAITIAVSPRPIERRLLISSSLKKR